MGPQTGHRIRNAFRCSALALALALAAGAAPPAAARTPVEPQQEALDSFAPYGRQYALMREELARYRALTEGDQWQPLPEGQTLSPGMRGPRVAQLRGLLMQYGDYPLDDHTDTAAADEYDARLQRAVKRFQRRHGLKEDGLVDRRTRERLNIDPSRHARTLAANLKRWEEMPKDLGPRYILVNIPDFSLRLMDRGQERYRMRVVVGKTPTSHQTPQLATRMTRVVFNPVWRVPRSIAVHELLPKGGGSLSAQGFRLINHRGRAVPFSASNIAATRRGTVSLQQQGGPQNALGRVKFVIPNRHAIFLHDTQSKHLFKRGQRAFSHGCIRLEKPIEFARMMLNEQNDWGEERIDRVVHSGGTRTVELEQPIPVYIAYWTAWVDEEGLLQFRPDIYNRDSPQDRAPAEKTDND